MAEITIVIPAPESKGYLRRMMKLAEIKDAIFNDKRDTGDITAPTLMLLVRYIAQFVQGVDGAPVEKEVAIDYLMDLTKDEYLAIMDKMGDVAVPKENATASNDTTPGV